MTEVTINSVFPSLEAQAARLNAASDRVNSLLTALEKHLVSLNIGLEFWHSQAIEASDSQGDFGPDKIKSRSMKFFGLARVDGKWCLAVKPLRHISGFYQGDMDCPFKEELTDGPVTPLLQSSRSLRTAALSAMPEFLDALNAHVQSTVDDIEQTAKILSRKT